MKLSHHAVATAQVSLSFLILVGFFAVLILEGLKLLAPGTASSLRDLIMLVGFFWFQRQRTSTDQPTIPPETKTP